MIYLDYAASNPLCPEAAAAVRGTLDTFGNPSSVHAAGRAARAEIDRARTSVARLLDVAPGEIIFTSGATEANALAIAGVLRAVQRKLPDARPRILVSPFEHSSVVSAMDLAKADGIALDIFPCDKDGVVSSVDVARMITPETALVVVMWASNITGAVQPIAEIGAVIATARKNRGAADPPLVFMSDAVQAVPWFGIRPADAGVDVVTFSGHKMYGPTGVGALRLRPGTPFIPPARGGGQEEGRRGGTENVSGIAGFGAAADRLFVRRPDDAAKALVLRRRLKAGLASVPGSRIVGASIGTSAELHSESKPAEVPEERSIPGIAYVHVTGVRGDELAMALDAAGVCVSAGSACDAGIKKTPAVFSAMGDRAASRDGGARFSFGAFTTEEDIDTAIAAVRTAAKRLRR